MSIRKSIKKLMSTLSPKATTHLMYYYNFGKVLNLKNPQGINEKLQYLKLKTYSDNPTVTQCVDKYRVRRYIEKRGFSDLLPALYGAYDTPQELLRDWSSFPDKLVIKCNHGCGYNILIKDKTIASKGEIENTLTKWMRDDYWKVYCEPQYKNVKKKIIVEEHLGSNILIYKFFCFDGIPRVSYVSSNENDNEKRLDYFDMNWNWLDISLHGHLHANALAPKPKNLNEMLELSKQLSSDFPFVRVDLYNIDGVIKFSELTFIPTGGNLKLKPESTIEEWGEWLSLANLNK